MYSQEMADDDKETRFVKPEGDGQPTEKPISDESSNCCVADGNTEDTTMLGPRPAVHDKAFRDLSKKIGLGWETLATYIGIKPSAVFHLKQDHSAVEDQIFHLLVMWRQSNTGQVNLVDTLASALRKTGRVDLADGFTKSTLEDYILRVLSTKLGSEWEQLATHLQCSREEIQKSKINYPGVDNQIFNLLVTWRQRQPHGTEIRKLLATALRHSSREDLARKLLVCSDEAWLLPHIFDVNVCRKELKDFYEDEKSSISIVPYDDEGSIAIEDIFVELELLDEHHTTNEVRKIKLLSYNDLVALSKKRVLVRGGPGSGKTTLVSKISHDWASNIDVVSGDNLLQTEAMSKFSLLLALNMRELKPGMSLAEAVRDQLLPDDTVVSKEGLEAYIQDNEVLIILDGYDEYPGGMLGTASKGSSKKSKTHDDGIMALLCATQLTNCHLIVTSRLHRVSDFGKLHKKYAHVELTGFAKKDVKMYIWKFFKVREEEQVSEEEKENQANTEKVLTEIESSSALGTLAKTPVILALLCILWKDDQELPKRVTPLYEKAMKYLIRHWQERENEEEPDEEMVEEISQELLMDLGKVALNGLFEDQLIFSAKDFDKDLLKKACEAGILSKEKKRSKSSMVQQISFVHKTFQEMCGGTYMANLAVSDVEAFVTYLKQITDTNIGDLEYLLRFCCGLNKKAAVLIIPIVVNQSYHVMVKVNDDCRLGYDDIKQDPWRLSLLLLFESQCTDEHNLLKPLFRRHKLRIRFHNAEVLVAVNFFLDSCNKSSMLDEVSDTELVGIRAHHVQVASKLIKNMHAVKTLKLVFLSRLEYAEMETLGSSICYLTSLTTLALEGRDCDTSGIIGKLASDSTSSKLIQEFSCHLSNFSIDALVVFISRQPLLDTLKLLDNNLKRHEIARLLTGIKDAKLQVLEIFWNEVGDSIKHVKPFLPTLHSLYLSNTRMKPEDWEYVFCGMAEAIHLTKLDLTWNTVEHAILKLAETPTVFSSLRVLTLRKANMKLKKEQIDLVCQWLGNLVNLEDLDLSDNDFGMASDEFSEQLAKLKHLNHLNLSTTELTTSVFRNMGSALKNMPCLQRLHLSETYIGDAMVEVAEGLRSLSELTWLNLEDAMLTSDGVIAISNAFEKMPKLKNLYLHGNSDIGVPGVEALFKSLHYVPSLECLEMRGLEVEYNSCSLMVKECFNELNWKHWECEKASGNECVVLDKLNADSVKKVVAVVQKHFITQPQCFKV